MRDQKIGEATDLIGHRIADKITRVSNQIHQRIIQKPMKKKHIEKDINLQN